MLEFRPQAALRNYLSRREARRLFWWVLGVGLAVLVIVRFGEIRQFLGSLRGRPTHDIDTRYYPSPKSGADSDSVTIVPHQAPTSETADDNRLQIDPSLLTEIRDDTPWIRPSEYPAWYHFWTVLKEMPPKILTERAQSAGFVELFQQPRAFRGKPIAIEGSARRANYVNQPLEAITASSSGPRVAHPSQFFSIASSCPLVFPPETRSPPTSPPPDCSLSAWCTPPSTKASCAAHPSSWPARSHGFNLKRRQLPPTTTPFVS